MTTVNLNLIPVDETQLVLAAGDDTQLVLSAGDETQIVLSSVAISNGLMMTDGSNSALALGSAGTPSLKFAGDANTGIFSPGADQFSITTGGTERLRIDGAGQIEAVSLGSAAAPTFSFTGDPNTGIYSPGADQLAISTAGTGRLFVASGGNVGIGTSAPSQLLHVNGNTFVGAAAAAQWSVLTVAGDAALAAAAPVFHFVNAAGSARFAYINHSGTGGDLLVLNQEAGALRLGTNNAERARIDSSGRLLLGTSSRRRIGTPFDPNSGVFYESSGAAAYEAFTAAVNRNDVIGPVLSFGKSRGTANGSNTIVVADDELGTIRFSGADGTDLETIGASITALVDGTPGTNDMPGRLVFSTTADGAALPTERMRITSAGNVGIGTTAPSVILDVRQNQAAYSYFDFYNTTAGGGIVWRQIVRNLADTGTTSIDIVKYTSGGFAIANNDTGAANFTAFNVGASERLRITSAGRVGIGTTSPGQQLSVTTATNDDGIILTNSSTNGGRLRLNSTGTGGRAYHIVSTADGSGAGGGKFCIFDNTASDAARFAITSAGNVGIGTTSPAYALDVQAGDARFKRSASDDAAIYFGSTTNNYIFGSNAGNLFVFATNGSERARIDSSGRLLVGTSASITALIAAGLQVQSTGANAYTSIGRWDNNAANPGLIFNKSRGGSVGTLGIVQANDNLAELSFTGDDGSAFVSAARIQAQVDGTPGTNDMPGRLLFLTTADGASSPTERMRITSAGLVGIGITNPGRTLTVSSSADTSIQTLSTGTGSYVQFTDSANSSYIGTNNGSIVFLNPTTERARIDSSGRLLVGTSTNTGGSLFQVNDNRIRIATAKTPASATDTGSAGEICWDANYIYVCTATNTWKRTAIATW